MEKGKILIVDDERSVLEMLKIVLSSEGYEVAVTPDPVDALRLIAVESPEVVVEDLRMPGMDGLELLKRIKSRWPQLPVVIITAFSTWDNAVEAMRMGAFDYIRKPFDIDQLRKVTDRAIRQYRLIREGREPFFDLSQLVGASEGMREIWGVVERVAVTDSTILITGESGTGKEYVARVIHQESHRASGPFIGINCAAFPETLLESELFGYRKGAFTGAVADKKGLMEVADGGTLFLDEVAEIPLPTQVKLLRVVESRELTPLGGTEARKIDIRLIAATNRNLDEDVRAGTFRQDLFWRLNVIPVRIPPLRERRSDIPLLAGRFLRRYAPKMGKDPDAVRISRRAQELLSAHTWPGNVRELENVIQRAVALCEGDEITERDIELGPLRRQMSVTIPEGFDLDKHLEEVDRGYIAEALARTGGNLTEAAKLLGISFRSLRYRVKKYGDLT